MSATGLLLLLWEAQEHREGFSNLLFCVPHTDIGKLSLGVLSHRLSLRLLLPCEHHPGHNAHLGCSFKQNQKETVPQGLNFAFPASFPTHCLFSHADVAPGPRTTHMGTLPLAAVGSS